VSGLAGWSVSQEIYIVSTGDRVDICMYQGCPQVFSELRKNIISRSIYSELFRATQAGFLFLWNLC
jgi:hypothetical protein